jgi:hypothetical protein
MVELETKLNDAGILYIPKELRDCFVRSSRKVKILSDRTAALFYPAEGIDYEEILYSLDTIRRDVIQSKRLSEKRAK